MAASRFRSGDRPSRTAEYMALFRAVETAGRADRRLFEDPYAQAMLSGPLRAVAAFARLPLAGRLVPWALDFGWPHTRSSGVVRTRLIDDLVRRALHAGASQLVLLGAGFDSRPYRLDEARSVAVFEVDHPATQNAKRARLIARLRRLPDHVRFVPVDFEAGDLEQALAASGFHVHASSVVVWEGVVSYLTPAAVERNFRLLARLLSPESLVIFTYVHRGALDGSLAFPEARRWKSRVRRSGEPFIFGFDPERLAAYLGPHGFTLVSDVSAADAAKVFCASGQRRESGSELYRIASARRQPYNESYV